MCSDDLMVPSPSPSPLRTVRMPGPQRRSGGAALGPTASQKPLGAAGRTKRPPRDGTRCPSWDGFRWSQRAARERSESHRGLNWSRHGSWQRPVWPPRPLPTSPLPPLLPPRRHHRHHGLFQLGLTPAQRGITSGWRAGGTRPDAGWWQTGAVIGAHTGRPAQHQGRGHSHVRPLPVCEN